MQSRYPVTGIGLQQFKVIRLSKPFHTYSEIFLLIRIQFWTLGSILRHISKITFKNDLLLYT